MTSPVATTTLPPITLGDPAQQDLTAYRGDTGRFRVVVLQDGAPLDVSAATWDCDIRATPDGALIASMTVTPVAGQTNAIDVELSASNSAIQTGDAGAGAATEAVWDLQMTTGTDPDTVVTTLLRGTITIIPDVSREQITPPDPGSFGAPAPGGVPPGPLPFNWPAPGPLVVHTIEDSGHRE